MIRSLKDRLSTQEIAVVAKISVDEVEKILKQESEELNKVGFYPHCEEKEIETAYNEGIAAGIEQNKIEMIKNLKDKLSTQEIADAAKISVAEVDRIFNLKQKKILILVVMEHR